MKQSLLEKTGILLLKKGFTIKSLTRTCFDILARKETQILLVKILEDANAVTEEYTKEMHRISSYINAAPIIIAEKAGDKLRDNIVYLRFGVYTLNLLTFENCINNKLPFVKRDHAGITAIIKGPILKQKMEQEGFSLAVLAKRLGVSRKMVQKYEKGESEISINKASKLYNIFGPAVFDKIDVFRGLKEEMQEHGKGIITKKYLNLGFKAEETHKVPFDVIAKKEKEIVLTRIGDKTSPQLKPLSDLINADKLVIFKKKKPKEKDIPALTKKEFLEFEKASELIKFLKEFEG